MCRSKGRLIATLSNVLPSMSIYYMKLRADPEGHTGV